MTWVFHYCHRSKNSFSFTVLRCAFGTLQVFSADAELIKEETVLQTSKLVLVKENGALNPPEVDYRERYCMWVRERNPFKTEIVNTSFTSLFDLSCFNRHFGEKIY